jgi:hypothetical protein
MYFPCYLLIGDDIHKKLRYFSGCDLFDEISISNEEDGATYQNDQSQ